MNENQIKGKLLALKMKKEEAENKVDRATKILFWVSGINFLGGIYNFLSSSSMMFLLISGVISLIIAALGFWSKKSPMAALTIAFLVLSVLFLIDFIGPAALGIVGVSIRLAVLLFLLVGIYNLISAKKIIKEYAGLESKLNNIHKD